MEYKVHSLIANKDINTKTAFMKEGDMKNLLIQEMTDKRYALYSASYLDYFYLIINDRKELDETFNEQLQVN